MQWHCYCYCDYCCCFLMDFFFDWNVSKHTIKFKFAFCNHSKLWMLEITVKKLFFFFSFLRDLLQVLSSVKTVWYLWSSCIYLKVVRLLNLTATSVTLFRILRWVKSFDRLQIAKKILLFGGKIYICIEFLFVCVHAFISINFNCFSQN